MHDKASVWQHKMAWNFAALAVMSTARGIAFADVLLFPMSFVCIAGAVMCHVFSVILEMEGK